VCVGVLKLNIKALFDVLLKKGKLLRELFRELKDEEALKASEDLKVLSLKASHSMKISQIFKLCSFECFCCFKLQVA
jgi:hypothetical protein